jgi:hypothetical protein
METGKMAKNELVHALNELMDRGMWRTKGDLMQEVLRFHPSTFIQLSDTDAMHILNRGNKIIMRNGTPPVFLSPEPNPVFDSSDDILETKEVVGRCVDLWKDDVPVKKRKVIGGPYLESAQDSMGSRTKPKSYSTIQRDSRSISIDVGSMEDTISNVYSKYNMHNFSFPIEEWPAKDLEKLEKELRVISDSYNTKIEVVGEVNIEEVES